MAFDAYTKLLLHFNGANQGTTFTDECGNTWTATGTTQLDTAEKVFGSASMHNTGAGNYISAPFNSALNPGTGNFTLDFRFKWNNTTGFADFFGIGPTPTSASGFCIYWTNTNYLRVYINATAYSFAWTPSANTWYHIALTRQAGTLRAWVDGVQKGADTTGAGAISPTSGTMYIGYYAGAGENSEPNGWFDELRWSNGIARWSTTPFPIPWYEYGGSVFESTSTLLVPTVTNLITINASKFWSVGTILCDTLYNEKWSGAAAANLPSLTCAATGHDYTSTLAVDLPSLTIAATGLTGGIGNLTKTLPALTIAAYGGATLQADLPALEISASGTTGFVASLSQDLPSLTIAATGLSGEIGNLNVNLPKIVCDAHGYVSSFGSLAQTLPMLKVQATGLMGGLGTADLALPMFTLSATGYVVSGAILSQSLPMLSIYAHGDQTLAILDYLVTVMNLKNAAVTEYENYDFNSFAKFNGVYLGAKSDGIYPLDGADDAGDPIAARFDLPPLQVDPLRIRTIYVLGRGGGTYLATIIPDEGNPGEVSQTFSLGSLETTQLDEARINLARGLKPAYLQVIMENQAGAKMDIDKMEFWAQKLNVVRRHK